MPSSKEYVTFILEQCKELSARPMMGEYLLYFRGKLIGGIYDNRLLVKPTKGVLAMMPDAEYQLPYEGAKEMLLVDSIEDGAFLIGLFEILYEELPLPKKKK